MPIVPREQDLQKLQMQRCTTLDSAIIQKIKKSQYAFNLEATVIYHGKVPGVGQMPKTINKFHDKNNKCIEKN